MIIIKVRLVPFDGKIHTEIPFPISVSAIPANYLILSSSSNFS